MKNNNRKANRNYACDEYTRNPALNNWKASNRDKLKNRDQDPFWYAKDEASIARIASRPWNDVVGTKIPSSTDDIIPGIMTIPYCRTAGSYCEEYGNTLTRVADTYFQYMTQGFTGSVDFESPDLLMTAMSGGSIIADMEECKRAFGVLNYYTDHNQYYARHMFEALGFDYDSFTVDHSKADFVSDYNIRVEQINKLIAVPKGFFAVDRWVYLAKWLFSDNSDPEYNTLFAYKCIGSMMYQGTAALTGTALKWVSMHSNNLENNRTLTYEGFFNYIDSVISALTGSDQREIFGALRRVYSDDKFYKIDELSEGYETEIVRNDIMSAALHNGNYYDSVTATYDAVRVPAGDDPAINQIRSNSGYPVVQDSDGNIICHIGGKYTSVTGNTIFVDYYTGDNACRLIDMYGHMDTAANLLDVTAAITAPSDWRVMTDSSWDGNWSVEGGSPDMVYQPIFCRSEVFLTPKICYFNASGDISYMPAKATFIGGDLTSHLDGSLYKRLALMSHINSHPLIRIGETTQYNTIADGEQNIRGFIPSYYLGEIDKYTSLPFSEIGKLHARTLTTLFNLPKSDRSVTK